MKGGNAVTEVSPNSYEEALTPHVTAYRDGAFMDITTVK